MTPTDGSLTVGMDVGGSHLTAAAFDPATGTMLRGSRISRPVDSMAPAGILLDALAGALSGACSAVAGRSPAGIGIAMPGPCDYERGISYIRGLAKYDSLYGLNLRKELRVRLGGSVPILFRNDAACFLLGECWAGAAKGVPRAMGITLGTGFGSAFCANGALVESGSGVPPNGWLYDQPFRDATAEEYFSARGLLRMAREEGLPEFNTPRELAEAAADSEAPRAIFAKYGTMMGQFLSPWVRDFAPRFLIVGGNVSRAFPLFGPALQEALPTPAHAVPSALLEDAALAGAASLPLHLKEPPSHH